LDGYSTGGERESKRHTVAPLDGKLPLSHLWTYYLLGGNKQQLAVYNGRETSELDACSNTTHRVHFYPTEYLTYGAGASALITTRPNQFREYKIVDHLGSTRVVLDSNGVILSTYDYEPFGKVLAKTGLDSRKSYIDKEKDKESGLGNFGVRSYDDNEGGGRFTSIDPMWEDYRAWSPYQYSMNNPMRLVDPSGLSGTVALEGNTATITQRLYFYQAKGSKLSPEDFNKQVQASMQSISQWDQKTANIAGKDYTLCLNVSYETISYQQAEKMSAENTSVVNNFIGISSEVGAGESSAQFNQAMFSTADIATGTTPAHEYGHLLGIKGHSEAMRGVYPDRYAMQNGVFDVMVGSNLKFSAPSLSQGFSAEARQVTSTNVRQFLMFNGLESMRSGGIYNFSTISMSLKK